MMMFPFAALWMLMHASAPASCPPPPRADAEAAFCKCGFSTVDDALSNARAVFAGTVVRVQENVRVLGTDSLGNEITYTGGWPVAVTLRVSRGWKGVVAGDTITVLDIAPCPVLFRPGEEYLVYAHVYESEPLTTSPCARTRRLAVPSEGLARMLPPTADEMETLDRLVRPRRRDVVEPVRARPR
jgi:hypothetical protein